MSARLYFAYGSNLDAEQMRERCPGSEPRFRARLIDHRVDFTHYSTRWSGGAADVVPEAGAIVWGVVYAMPEDDVTRLDAFEGGYTRRPFRVLDDDHRSHETLSYTVRQKMNFVPSEIYLEKMLDWSERWEFPEEHVALLRLARFGSRDGR